MASVKILGVEELQKELSKLSAELKYKAVRSGLVFAAKPVKQKLKQNTPRRTGRLASTVGHRTVESDKKSGTVAILVGHTIKKSAPGGFKKWNYGWLANILDREGAKPHSIKPGSGRRKIYARAGLRKPAVKWGTSFFANVQHPGVNPRGYIRKTYNQTGDAVSNRFYEGLSRFLARNAK